MYFDCTVLSYQTMTMHACSCFECFGKYYESSSQQCLWHTHTHTHTHISNLWMYMSNVLREWSKWHACSWIWMNCPINSDASCNKVRFWMVHATVTSGHCVGSSVNISKCWCEPERSLGCLCRIQWVVILGLQPRMCYFRYPTDGPNRDGCKFKVIQRLLQGISQGLE